MCDYCDCDCYDCNAGTSDSVAELAADLAAKLCEHAGHRHRYPDCREPECANRRAVLRGDAAYFPTPAERLRLAS